MRAAEAQAVANSTTCTLSTIIFAAGCLQSIKHARARGGVRRAKQATRPIQGALDWQHIMWRKPELSKLSRKVDICCRGAALRACVP